MQSLARFLNLQFVRHSVEVNCESTAVKQPTVGQERWFKIREELSGRRASLLMALSFLLPLAIWCIASYVPFIWHPDIRLEVSAERTDVSTVYTAGDHVSKEFFPTFRNAVREANRKILEDRKSGQGASGVMVRRDNLKKLRQLAPLAI